MAYSRRKFYKRKSTRKYSRRRMQPRIKRARLMRNVRNRSMTSVGKGFPKKLLFTHKFVETRQLSSGTLGTIGSQKWSANGLYDPFITGVGHQPMYFDTLTGIYRHYTVIGSKIVVRLVPTTPETSAAYVGLHLSDNVYASGAGDMEQVAEQSSGQMKLVPCTVDKPIVMSYKFSAKKVFGGSVLGNDELQGNVGANPAEQSCFTLHLQSADATQVTFYAQVTITYIAVWDELVLQPKN